MKRRCGNIGLHGHVVLAIIQTYNCNMSRWALMRLSGGKPQLRRKMGKNAVKYRQLQGEWPRAVRMSELFDIIWNVHHKHGHLRTAQALQEKLLFEEGVWGIPRPAVLLFISCCLACASFKAVRKQVCSCSTRCGTNAWHDQYSSAFVWNRTIPTSPFTPRLSTCGSRLICSVTRVPVVRVFCGCSTWYTCALRVRYT